MGKGVFPVISTTYHTISARVCQFPRRGTAVFAEKNMEMQIFYCIGAETVVYFSIVDLQSI